MNISETGVDKVDNSIENKKPDPNNIFPRSGDKTTCYIRPLIKNPNIVVGDFSMYHDFEYADEFEKRNVLYHYPINGDKLIIGRFCSIACGTKFIMNGANHTLNSFSTYPFPVFRDEWDDQMKVNEAWDFKGDTVIGNDVWIGYEAVIMPGVHIGDGAIIGTRAVVTRDIPPYSIAAGVPAKVIKKRFDEKTIDLLMKIKWWDWDVKKIRENISIIRSGNLEKLEELKTAK